MKTPKGRYFTKSEENCHTCISVCQKETTSEQSLPVQKFNTDLISLLPHMLLQTFSAGHCKALIQLVDKKFVFKKGK